MRGIAVIPAEVPLVDRLDVVTERAVVAAGVPRVFQRRGQGELFGDLDTGLALVHSPQGLVVHVGVGVTLPGQEGGDPAGSPGWPVVRREDDIGPGAEQPHRLTEIAGPGARVADLGAAQGQDLVQGVGGVLGHAQRPGAGKEDVHLGRGFGAGCHLEDHADTVDNGLLAGVRDVDGGRQQRDRAVRGGHAQPGADLPGRSCREVSRVDVRRAPRHRRARVDVLRHRVLQETRRRVDRGARIGDPGAATVVIGVRVRDDQRLHRPVTPVLAVQGQGRRGGLVRHERVDNDHAAVGLDQGHVRQVQAPDLIDPIGQLIQAMPGGQLSLPPQARVRRAGGVPLDEVVSGAVPDHVPIGREDDRVIERPDEPPLDVIEVGQVSVIEVCHCPAFLCRAALAAGRSASDSAHQALRPS